MNAPNNAKRINISMDPKFHGMAKRHAKIVHGTTFSGLVTKLIIQDMNRARDLAAAVINGSQPKEAVRQTLQYALDALDSSDSKLQAVAEEQAPYNAGPTPKKKGKG